MIPRILETLQVQVFEACPAILPGSSQMCQNDCLSHSTLIWETEKSLKDLGQTNRVGGESLPFLEAIKFRMTMDV